jgi:hypothetical protein
MWLDDFHDNYLDAINDITNNIKNRCFPYNNITKVIFLIFNTLINLHIFSKDGLIKFFRDSTGIANYIDVAKIFKYFIKNW